VARPAQVRRLRIKFAFAIIIRLPCPRKDEYSAAKQALKSRRERKVTSLFTSIFAIAERGENFSFTASVNNLSINQFLGNGN
jgi:hypothetical protein